MVSFTCIMTAMFAVYHIETIELNLSNYDQLIKEDRFSLILFYSPWQEDCKPLFSIFEKIEKIVLTQTDIFIGTVNCYLDLKLASKFYVDEFCSVKYILKGSNVAESYTGKYDEESLNIFIEDKSQVKIKESLFKTYLLELNAENFQRITKDKSKTALVLFYAKWCKKCIALLETMKRVAYIFKNNPQCIISQIDGEQHYSIAISEGVGLYPTFMFYSKNNKDGDVYLPGKYDENWSEKNITNFLKVKCENKIVDDYVFDRMVGLIDELDIEARNFLRSNAKRRNTIIRDTVLKIQNLKPYKRYSADYYVQVMRSIIQDGENFIMTEIRNIDKIMLGKIEEDKKEDLQRKRNILQSFQYHVKDEL